MEASVWEVGLGIGMGKGMFVAVVVGAEIGGVGGLGGFPRYPPLRLLGDGGAEMDRRGVERQGLG